MRRALIAMLIAGSATFVGLAPASAAAPAAPTIDTIDWTTTPGHVTGTVTSDSAWVFLAVGDHGSWSGASAFVAVDSGTHQAVFDLETWGMRNAGGAATQVGLTPCTGSTIDTCTIADGQPVTVSEVFQPTDMRPDVSFTPEDGMIGPGEQLTATVSDPQGGGLLKAWWTSDADGSTTPAQVLDRDGTTQLTVTEGAGTATVVRCAASDTSGTMCDPFDPPLEFRATVDTHGPVVTSTSLSKPYVRPEAADAASQSITISAYGPDAALNDTFVLVDAAGEPMRYLTTWVEPGVARHAFFDGRHQDGTMLPSGTYAIQLRDAGGQTSTTTISVPVQRLVAKTFKTTVTARGSKVDQYVGRCSTLRTPASRGWSGSLGYYANARCRSTRWADSAVATQHRVVLPVAASYVDVQLSTYSGASRGYGRSQAVMLYDNPSETAAVASRTLGATLATRAAARVPAAKVLRTVNGRRHVYWEVATAYGQRYDVKSFTLTVRYKVWA